MKRIQVLIVAGSMNVGGIENQLMHLLRQADPDQFQINFTTTEDHPFYEREMLEHGAECLHIPNTDGKHFFRYCYALFKLIRAGKYDIVHSNELFHSGLVLLTARLAGVKHRFVHAHNWKEGNDPKLKKSIQRRVYNSVMKKLIQWNATDFIACSSLAGEFLFGDRIMKQSNYHLVYNSVDTSRFIERYYERTSGEFCGDGWTNVLQVGRFTPVKNQLFAVEIAKELKKRGKKIRFLFVGNNGGEYEEAVRKRIKVNNLEENVLLLGIREDIDSLMRKSSAFLLPSLYEGMPLVMIEAQAAGLPCISADTYSHEVDFGIGTVEWLRLESGVNTWADAIERTVKKRRAEKTAVIKAIENGGFDSKMFAEKICKLYLCSFCGGNG